MLAPCFSFGFYINIIGIVLLLFFLLLLPSILFLIPHTPTAHGIHSLFCCGFISPWFHLPLLGAAIAKTEGRKREAQGGEQGPDAGRLQTHRQRRSDYNFALLLRQINTSVGTCASQISLSRRAALAHCQRPGKSYIIRIIRFCIPHFPPLTVRSSVYFCFIGMLVHLETDNW